MMSSPPDKSCSSSDTSSPDESLDVVIRENYQHLVENLRIFELLTGAHSFKGIISDKLYSEIMAREPDQKLATAQKFINAFLDSNDQTKGTVLKAALRGRADDLVRTILCKGLSDEVTAHFHDMAILDHSRELLITKIECDEMLMSSCLSKNLITREEHEEVRAKNSKSGPSRGLVHLLESVKKTLNGYRKLLKVLWGLDYKSVVKQVDRVEYYSLKAEHKSGGSGMVATMNDDDVSRNSSNQDVEKGDTKILNIFNIPPQNKFSEDGPVSSRTRSKLADQHASEDSGLQGTVQVTCIVQGFAIEAKLGFRAPHLTDATVMKKNARALSLTDYNNDSLNTIAAPTTPKLYVVNDDGARHQLKQGYTRESSENREISNYRICDSEDAKIASEHRHSQDHQDVKDRYRSQSGHDVRHQASTVHGAQGNVSKKRDLHQTTNTRNCNSGELRKNSVSVESLASHNKSLSLRSDSTTFHGDVTKDLTKKETTRADQDRVQQPRLDQQRQGYISCVHCEKRFLTEQKLNSHVETCDKKISQAELRYYASAKHSRSTGEEKRASVKQSLSYSAESTKKTVVVPRSASQMTQSSTEMPRSSVNRTQPPVANPRPPVFRCVKCHQSFLEKKSLDKHERKGNCHL